MSSGPPDEKLRQLLLSIDSHRWRLHFNHKLSYFP